eukprot:2304938-Amphidinium_carterae.1
MSRASPEQTQPLSPVPILKDFTQICCSFGRELGPRICCESFFNLCPREQRNTRRLEFVSVSVHQQCHSVKRLREVVRNHQSGGRNRASQSQTAANSIV